MIPYSDIDNWFTYHPPTDAQKAKYERIRVTARQLAYVLADECPPSADRSAALRLLREAVMTAIASIACDRSDDR